MTWAEHHRKSEELASLATILVRQGQTTEAISYYRLAAEAEAAALENLDVSKNRTLGITVVSASALWFKGQEFGKAKQLAYRWLATDSLPDFSIDELEEILREILILERVPIAV